MLGQVERDDLARVGRGEGDAALAGGAGVGEVGHEDRLAGEDAFADREQLAHQPSLGCEPSPILASKVMSGSM